MKLVKSLVIVCLILVAVVAGRYLYNNDQSDKRREAMIKEDEKNKRILSEAHEKTSGEMARDIRNY